MPARGHASGWHKLFANPEGLIASANRMGFANSTYHAAKDPPPAYISTGTLIELAPAPGVSPNNAGIYVYGSHREWVDEIRLKLNINDPDTSRPAIRRFMDILRAVFDTVSDESLAIVERAMTHHQNAEYEVDDANLSVRRDDFKNNTVGAHSLNMVFHRRSAQLQD